METIENCPSCFLQRWKIVIAVRHHRPIYLSTHDVINLQSLSLSLLCTGKEKATTSEPQPSQQFAIASMHVRKPMLVHSSSGLGYLSFAKRKSRQKSDFDNWALIAIHQTGPGLLLLFCLSSITSSTSSSSTSISSITLRSSTTSLNCPMLQKALGHFPPNYQNF